MNNTSLQTQKSFNQVAPDCLQLKRINVVVPAGPLGRIGEIGPNSLLLGVNEHDFTDATASWTFEKICDILVSSSNAERTVRFLVPPPPPAVQFEQIAAHESNLTVCRCLQPKKKLGAGTFSVVREATHKTTGERFAIECLERSQLTADDLQALVAEVKLLRKMQHPHMVKLYDVFQVEKYFFRVIEFMAGGELFEQIVKKNFYTERSTCLVEVLLETIAFCYDANVVHRDLKPENVLLSSAEMIQILSLDFGVATKTAIQTRDAGLSYGLWHPRF
ncbi:unnamed protein product [Peronospora belbahrii]|uniref:Protein kinase domain-containing protein n=1 Tax=Peronospora belbahrii TaxID=622444 RepID=A0ABN8CUJ2_9STRA|nr:unnamed protein product [Peronospora belbahrii]